MLIFVDAKLITLNISPEQEVGVGSDGPLSVRTSAESLLSNPYEIYAEVQRAAEYLQKAKVQLASKPNGYNKFCNMISAFKGRRCVSQLRLLINLCGVLILINVESVLTRPLKLQRCWPHIPTYLQDSWNTCRRIR